ncbi:MAG: type II toxin-antitoxin system HicA family toxin [Lentisphaeria bacterium]
MSRKDKLLDRLFSLPKDFTWEELTAVMNHCGYTLCSGGGSRRKFHHAQNGWLVILHEPHPGRILKAYQLREVAGHLKQNGFKP